MLDLRRSTERGLADHGWLRSRHSFSFADYVDPAHMGFGPLRVINEDVVAPGKGFGTHAHRDMEIVSWVLSGALEHKDSLGNGSVIRPGDAQRMSAGSGVRHSEFNPSPVEPVHFLQIWVMPDRAGIPPSYGQRHFDAASRRGRLCAIVAGDALRWQQDAVLFAGSFDGDASATHPLAAGRLGYVHVARGAVEVNGVALGAGDALKLSGEDAIRIGGGREAELMVFDLPR